MQTIEYKVVIQKDEENRSWWAYCPDLPGCNSIGDTLEEVKINIKEAILGYLEVLESMKKDVPMPSEDNLIIEKVPITI
ncbi:MAG: type II toxin-antitoxin system HicB family antitoxin [Candidatus Hydrogenedentota bacterium]